MRSVRLCVFFFYARQPLAVVVSSVLDAGSCQLGGGHATGGLVAMGILVLPSVPGALARAECQIGQ